MTKFDIAQIVSVLTIITICIGILQKEKSKTMLWFTAANITYLITYLLLERYLGMILVGVATLRTLTYSCFALKKIKPKIWVLVLFEAAIITLSIFNWTDYLDLFMIANLVMVTYTTWQDNMTVLRVSYIFSNIFLIIYNVFVGAYVSVVSEVVLLAFTTYSIIRYDILKKKPQKQESNQKLS